MDFVERGSLPERYEIVLPAGRGGMGVVFRGFDRLLARPVALKFLASGGNIDLAVALREARALAQLSHEGVLRVFDVVEGAEGVWIVAEWLEGRSLEALPRPGTLPEVLALAWRLLETLAAVHDAGIVHRDIKPSNIMICASGRAVLIDFGVAFLKGTNSGFTLAGTPRYSAPWCFEGDAPGRASDLFSLGLVLLELLAGQPVVPDLAPIPLYRFLRKKLPERVEEILDGKYPPLEPFIQAILDDEKELEHAALAAALLRRMSSEEPSSLLRRWVAGDPFPWAPVLERLRIESESASPASPRERARWLAFRSSLEAGEPMAPAIEPMPSSASTRHRREVRARRLWVSVVASLAALAGLAVVGAKLFWWGPTLSPGGRSSVTPSMEAVSSPTVDSLSPTPAVAAVSATPPPRLQTEVVRPRPRVTARPRIEGVKATPPSTPKPMPGLPPCAVQFSANVWARLFVNGQFLAQLPTARSFALPPGKHRVRLENPMMEPFAAEIRVPATEEERFHFVLKPVATPGP